MTPETVDTPPRPAAVRPARKGGSRAVLLAAARATRRQLAAAAVLRSGHQACEALVPVVVGVLVDRAVDGGSTRTLLGWLAVLAADFLALSLCFRFGSRATVAAGELAAHGLRVRLAGRLLAPGAPTGHGRLPGELLSVAVSDTQQVGRFLTTAVQAVASLVALALGAAVLLHMSVALGLLVLLGIPAALFGMDRLGRPLERRGAAEQAAAARASGVAVDCVAGLRVLKGLRAEAPAHDRYVAANRASLRATVGAARFEAAMDGAATALTGVLVAAVALAAGRLAAAGDIGLGDLVACTGLCQTLIGPTQSLMFTAPDLARAKASAARTAELLDGEGGEGREGGGDGGGTAGTDPAGRAPAAVRGELRMTGLAHRRLSGLDLEVAAGELVGLVVPDPDAAADLLACLRGQTPPGAGDVRLDGVPLHGTGARGAPPALLVAPHHPFLFDGTILDNLRPDDGREPDLSGPLGTLLPAPPDTRVGERGAFLSGGQRQRVALARALHAGPAVLVLDEPTTAVDPVTESQIAAALRTLRAGRTTLVLTSSPILLAACDRAVLITGGTVTADAPHADLAASEAAYRTAVFA